MTNIKKMSLLLLLMGGFSSCSVKSTASKNATSTGNSPITTNCVTSGNTTTCTTNGTTTTTTTGGISCDGINNTGATQCYYKNISTVQVMGVTTANIGKTIWSSADLGSSFQPHFVTDEIFNVR